MATLVRNLLLFAAFVFKQYAYGDPPHQNIALSHYARQEPTAYFAAQVSHSRLTEGLLDSRAALNKCLAFVFALS